MSTNGAPTLATSAILAALQAEDMDTAMGLIAGHDRDVRAALGNAPIAPYDESGWQALLTEQSVLLQELQAARSAAADTIQRLKGNRRSVQAYQSGSER